MKISIALLLIAFVFFVSWRMLVNPEAEGLTRFDSKIFTPEGEIRDTTLAHLLLFLAMSGLLPQIAFCFGYAGTGLIASRGFGEIEFLRDPKFASLRVSIFITTLTQLIVIYISLGFFFIPEGTDIRPMGWAVLLFLLAALNAAIAIPFSIAAFSKSGFPRLSLLSGVYALTPWFTGALILGFAASFRGFTLAP